jgi:hypothetical protein
MAGTCPPHHWVIGMEATHGVFPARCKKCGRKRTFPACIDSDLEKVITFPVTKKVVIRLEPGRKSKRERPGRPPKWESLAMLWKSS